MADYNEAIKILQTAHGMPMTIRLAIEALEKQIPKKPFVDYYGDLDCMCPTCHRVFKKIRKGKMPAHCSCCGQAIDWSEA